MASRLSRKIWRFCRARWVLLSLLAVSALLLTGCVRYEVGVNVSSQFSGEIVQHVKLGDQLTNFSRREAERWLDTIEQRARRLRGRVQHLSDAEIAVTIPFANGQELAERFNRFFDPSGQRATSETATSDELVQLAARAQLRQNNFLLLERDRLALDIDLRGLSVLDDAGSTLAIDPGSLLDLEFALQTPWGARARERPSQGKIAPPFAARPSGLVWRLQPGQVNHIEAVYWLPSWLGLGTVAIAALVAAGSYAKSRWFPTPRPPTPTAPGTAANEG